MIITHKLKWDKCLSHQIWPQIEKGWKDEDKEIHFFWGLAGDNISEIRKCIENNKEWWFVDTGYLTQQIIRYPIPKIVDTKRTYFRICKGAIHTNRGKVNTPARLEKLIKLGIDAEFKGWDTGDTKHILLCPSSQTVTYHINGISQDEWIKKATEEIKQHTDRKIILRNKPRPGNQWWNTDIKKDLKHCHAMITNFSLSAFDALLNYVPVFAEGHSVMGPVTSRDLKYIEKPLRPGRKTMDEWLKFVAENQFTLEEMASGEAYEILRYQNEN
jgi:hypothetical protein